MRICLFFLLLINTLFPQDTTDTSVGDRFAEDVNYYLQDCGAFFISPLSAEPEHFLYAAGITAATLAVMSADSYVKNHVGRSTSLTLNNDFWDFPTSYGIITYANIFSVSLYAGGLFSGHDEVRRTGRLLIEALTVSGVTVMLFRFIAGRVRPYYNEGPWAFRWFETSNEIQSFPSGHTTVAFALSTVLAERIDTWWSRALFYGLSSMTAFARVYNNQHWMSDVFTGGLLGLGSGLFVVNRENSRTAGFLSDRLSIIPSGNGLNFLYKLN